MDGSKGCYEWWYYDSDYPDGTVLVLFFYSKMPDVDGSIKPISSMELTLPDGRKFSEEVYAPLFDGGYLRFEGTATVEKLESGTAAEKVSDPAVWELMYFGKACADETYRAFAKK